MLDVYFRIQDSVAGETDRREKKRERERHAREFINALWALLLVQIFD